MQNKAKILVIDDEKSVRDTLGSILIMQGYELAFANNGKEALEKVGQFLPDLILLDIMMPYIDGYEVCKRLRENPEFQEIPIIMLSALDDRDSRLKGIQAGADDFISKPFDFTELLARVKTITRFNRYRKLLEERTKFKKIVELLPDGIVILDIELNVCLINEALIQIFALNDENEIIGKKISNFFSESIETELVESIQNIIYRKSGNLRFETKFKRSNGSVFDADLDIGNYIYETRPSAIVILRDITQRKLAEKALKESESRYRSISELISDFVYTLNVFEDNKLHIAWMTDAFNQITGYSIEEMDDLDPESLIYPLDRFTVNNHISNLLTGNIDICEFRIIKKDGDVVWLRNSGRPIIDKITKKVTNISGAIQNITERIYAQRNIKNSEERYRVVVEEQNDLICRFADSQKLIFVNEAYCKYFSRRPIELIGENFIQCSSDSEMDEIIHKINSLNHSNPTVTFEQKVIFPDGEIKWLNWNVRTLFDSDGNLLEYQGIAIDISEKKKAFELAKKTEEKYRIIFEESQDIVFVCNTDGLFLDINHAGVEILGYNDKNEILKIKQNSTIYSNPVLIQELVVYLQEFKFIKNYELILKKKSGESVVVLQSATAVFNDENKIIAFRGIMHDITYMKQLQKELIESQKMESIGRLTGGIAHDFNNMLTIIMGHADLAKMYVPPESKAFERILAIQQSSERAAWFIRQLLVFSRKQVLQVASLSINEILKDFAKLLHRVIGEDIELKIITRSENMISRVDINQIFQVLLNLTVNARDAMPKGGNLTFETFKKIIDDEYCKWHADAKSGAYIVISVTDTGCGMDSDTTRRIFEPFFTTKKENEGTGLGLSIVYGIVRQHNGFVVVFSEVNKGTTFNVYLPLVEDQVKAIQDEKQTLVSGKETILLVEDDDTLRNISLDTLKYLGYIVYTANNGANALEVFNEKKDEIDLVLIDVVMPKLGGKEAVEKMKKLKPSVKYLYVTGYSLDSTQTSFILEQDADFIQKPWNIGSLSTKVRDILDR